MEPEETVVQVKHKRFDIVEILLSIVTVIVLAGAFLWNWDGFWQTEIPLLANTQKTYLPAKYQEEQNKLSNLSRSTKKWEEALNKITKLEKENNKLKLEVQKFKNK